VSVSVAIRWLLAVVLALAAAAKVVDAGRSRSALRAWGLGTAPWVGLVGIEAAVAAALAADLPAALWAAAGLLGSFAAALAAQLARGRAGAPCACFGGRGRVGVAALLRATALAALAALAAADVRASLQTWLVLGLVVALAGVCALAFALLALAREVGELRLRLPAQAALSIPGEGPELGSRVSLGLDRPYELGLAVFTSEGCPACVGIGDAVDLIAGEPGVSVRTYDERRDADVWLELGVPGSPYAVVVDESGVVLSKGTFNTLSQLEGLLAYGARPALA
jgi:hypothetical protein